MNIIQGDSHESLTATYQALELARLNDTLKQCGVADVALRRKICETYFFQSGYFLDSCWFSDQGHHFRPGVYFSQLDASNKETGTVFLPEAQMGTMFHEYAHGNATWLYDEHAEDASEIKTGDANAA